MDTKTAETYRFGHLYYNTCKFTQLHVHTSVFFLAVKHQWMVMKYLQLKKCLWFLVILREAENIVLNTVVRCGPGQRSRYNYSLDWTVRGTNPGRGEIFRTRPHRSWNQHSLIYDLCRVSFPEVKRLGRGVDHVLPSSAEVKKRVALYRYSPSGHSWPVL
jgi:hypothetical protein